MLSYAPIFSLFDALKTAATEDDRFSCVHMVIYQDDKGVPDLVLAGWKE